MSSYITDDSQTTQRRRIICSACERPTTVCLCALIPASPLTTTNTEIIILQHPHEQRHPLATVPVLNKCITNCQVLTGRRLRRGKSDLLDQLYNDDGNSTKSIHAAFLFPELVTPSPAAVSTNLQEFCVGRSLVCFFSK
ncbi:DTW domain-containing protein 2 [Tanacetum coccineum]|uniref:tRNA-uridine aminocarboxypropyltransferase n=1 Tax=Tanacetum coccineum TaxID=301880 RepID=A0ABQ5CPK8_9ASTR